MVDTRPRIPSGLLNVSQIDSSRVSLLSLFHHHFRTVLAVQGSCAAPIGAPWTAPGRSEQRFPPRSDEKAGLPTGMRYAPIGDLDLKDKETGYEKVQHCEAN